MCLPIRAPFNKEKKLGRKLNRHSAQRDERQAAEQREQEAKREIDLLLNRTEQETESDFYPYHYLAAEGFIPGYNFPRLPLRALIPASEQTHIVDRPRFLGLGELGPRNILYHEGRKRKRAGETAHIRHPQYAAFIVIMLGFLLQWPTLITLVMFPILVVVYVKLAHREEREVLAEFGNAYAQNASLTPGFIPRWSALVHRTAH